MQVFFDGIGEEEPQARPRESIDLRLFGEPTEEFTNSEAEGFGKGWDG